MTRQYHIDIDKKAAQGATVALLPGDPFRCEPIAEEIDKVYGGGFERLAWRREFRTFLCKVNGKSVLVTSTGIGGPSTSIAIDELAQVGIKSFLRVGTCGSIQKNISVGDVVITSGAVRLDGASTHYAPIQYPAVPHFDILSSLVEGAKEAEVKYHVGVTASSDTFYPGEGRDDAYRKYIIKDVRLNKEEWQNLGVLNFEMESSTVLTLTSSMGLKGGCITGVVNTAGKGTVLEKDLKKGEENAIRSAVASLKLII